MKKIFSKICIVLVLVLSIFLFSISRSKASDTLEEPLILSNGKMVYYAGTEDPVMLPVNYETPDRYFRGVWVTPLCDNLPYCSDSELNSYKQEVLKMFDIMEYYNLNALVYHVRIFNDSLYESTLNPRSPYMTTSFDVLSWVIEEAHKRGIEFHAWFNPYRVYSSGGSIEKAVTKYKDYPQNPASKAENMLENASGGVILNPGLPEVRQFIVDTCMEVVNNYDIDAVHFDDYFYISDIDDSSTRDKYNTGNLSIDDFRRKQVDLFIESLHESLEEYNNTNNKRVQLGISPSGIYRNGDGKVTYDGGGRPITNGSRTSGFAHYGNYLYSDTLKWAIEGWIDYLLPQSYWAFSHPIAGFADVMGWWDKAMKYLKCNLYSGMGIYMAESPGSNYSWGFDPYEASNQVLYTSALEKATGTCFFDLDPLTYSYEERGNGLYDRGLNSIRLEYWSKKAILPIMENMTPQYVNAVTNFKVEVSSNGNKLSFNKVDNAKFYVIYRSKNPLTFSADEVIDIIGSNDNVINYMDSCGSEKYNYGVVAQSHTNHLSAPVEVNLLKYKVKFFDIDGNLLKEEIVESGKSATAPTAPTRPDHSFFGWGRDYTCVTKDLDIYPKYDDSLYTVRFYNDLGELINTQEVNYNSTCYSPEISKEGYTFVGWTEDIKGIKFDLDVYPIFEKKKCVVTFLDWDGTELYSYEITSGKAGYAPEDPERKSYKFIGWDKEIGIITDDTTFTAQYEAIYYVVTFINSIDGSVIDTASVIMYGDAELPEAPVVNGYRFLNWQGNYKNVNYNSTVKAIYDEIMYLVTIVDEEGNVIVPEFEYFLADGYTMPTPKEISGKEFVKWSHDINNLGNDEEEVTIRPLYRTNGSKVTFKTSTGLDLGTFDLNNDTLYPELPVIDEMTFVKWDKDLTDLLETGTLTALYESFTVTFATFDGTLIEERKVTGNSVTNYPEPIQIVGYKFTSWEKVDLTNIKSNLVVHALYEAVPVIVDYYNANKELIETRMYQAGEHIIDLPPVVREGYNFRRWDYQVNGDKVIAMPLYDVYYAFYYGFDNELIEQMPYTEHVITYYPKTVTAPAGYKFVGWDNTDIKDASGDVLIHALFEEIKCTVYYYDFYGNLIDTENVSYGTKASYDIEIPEIKGYTFKGFDFNDVITSERQEINLVYEKNEAAKSGCNKGSIVFSLFTVFTVFGLAFAFRKKH